MSATYTDNNPKTIFGAAKPNLSYVPPTALLMVGQVMANGASKYGPMNWRDAPVTNRTYIDAAFRHMLKYLDGQDFDEESHLHELAHAAASLMIVLDAKAQGSLIDDRPTVGMAPAFIRNHTKPIGKTPSNDPSTPVHS